MKCLLLIFLLIPGFLYSQTPIIRAENSSSFANDTVLVPITASNFSDIGAITLKIQFSSISLTFMGAVNWDSRLNEALSGIDGNVITLAWDGLNAVSYTYGKIAELKFIYKGGLGEVKFNSALSEIADSSGKAISCTYTDGRVTQIPAPSAPALISPANLSQVMQSEQVLTWTSVDNAKIYKLQVSKDSLFSDIILSDSSVKAPSRKVQGLSNNTNYFWRASAVNGSGTSPWSQVWTFKTVVTLPLKPVPVSPPDLSRHQPADLRLSWTPSLGAEYYSVNLYEYIPKGSEIVVNLRSSLSNITAASVDISGLLEGTKYLWTVRARNIAGVSDSASSSFSTRLIAPEQLKALVYDNIVAKLTWLDKSQNELGYIIERSRDNAPISFHAKVPANQTNYSDSLLLPATKFTYRIKAFNAVDSSDYSNEASVEIITSVKNPGGIPKEFSLSQNYPNPFNPSTVIRYSLQSEARVKIQVYDLLGQLVSELVNNVQSAGYYEEVFTAPGLPSGIYYYSINAESTEGKNNFKAVRKMLLCK